jgi:hypothetical protein
MAVPEHVIIVRVMVLMVHGIKVKPFFFPATKFMFVSLAFAAFT